MPRFHFVLAAVAAMALTAAHAETVAYLCRQPEVARTDWLTPVMVVRHDTAAGTAIAADAVTRHFSGGPAQARITRDDDKAVTFRWSVRVNGQGGRRATVRYTLRIDKATLESQANATVLGYQNDENLRGRCEILKDKPGKRRK